MKSSELRNLSEEELVAKVRDLSRELVDARMQLALAQLADNTKLRKLRKDIARVKTIQRERRPRA